MARTTAIVGALWTAVRRDARTIGSFTGNNLFFVSLVFLFLNDREAALTLNVMIGIILFFPLSANPLRKIPAERLAMWPVTKSERGLLRILSPWLNPMTWILAILALRHSVSAGLWGLIAALFAIAFAAPSISRGQSTGWVRVPNFPGPLNQLIRKNLREMLTTLDFYCALILSAAVLFFRIKGVFPRDALLPMTLLVAVALSSYAQTLFGLDGAGGLIRYRLLPLPGWQLLIAKDSAYLLGSLVLYLPLSPLAGVAATLVALALGHSASVSEYRRQTRWRFSSGASFGSGMFLVAAMALLAAGTVYKSPLLLVPCIAGYVWSVWRYGRALEVAEFFGDFSPGDR